MDKTIRVVAECVFFQGDRILVDTGYDQVKGETFFRPLGGSIEFGEAGRDAIAREIREEIGAEITELHLIETLENIFTYEGETGHEIVQVYTANFTDPVFYQTGVICMRDAEGCDHRAVWKPLSDFGEGGDILYPDGLLHILLEWQRMLGMMQAYYQPDEGPGGFDWDGALREMHGE